MKIFYSLFLIYILVTYVSNSQNINAEKIFEKCATGVVMVKTPTGFGSGFFISEDGWIATNHHVLSNSYGESYPRDDIKIMLKDGTEYEVMAVDYTSDHSKLDLALIKINIKPETILPLDPSDEVTIGSDAVAIGHPKGFNWTQTKGSITNDYNDFIQTDISINPGNSGGSILNKKGQVIGIATLKRTDMEGTGFAIKVKKLREVLNSRGIHYNTEASIVLEGSPLKTEWDILNKSKQDFENEKQIFNNEKKKLSQEKEDLLRLKSESIDVIKDAEPLLKMKEEVNNKLKEITEREITFSRDLSHREIKLNQKEYDLNEKTKYYSYLYPNHFLLELLANGGYYIGQNIEPGNISYGVSIGLLFRFDIDVENKVAQYSNRIGFQYIISKDYNFDKKYLSNYSKQYISVVLDFAERLRFGAGIDFSEQSTEFSKRQLCFPITLYFNRGEIPFALDGKIFSDQKFNNIYYTLGICIGYGGYFFRW